MEGRGHRPEPAGGPLGGCAKTKSYRAVALRKILWGGFAKISTAELQVYNTPQHILTESGYRRLFSMVLGRDVVEAKPSPGSKACLGTSQMR